MFDHLLLTIVISIVFIGQLNTFWPFLGGGRRKRQKKSKPAKKQSQLTSPAKRPPCPACVATEESQENEVATPDEPPPMIEQTDGRPRSVDTSSHFCPRKKCRYYGWLGRGNIRANGHSFDLAQGRPDGGRWRQLQSVACHKYFMETVNTIFYGKKTAAETIWQALKALAEGLEIRATARVFDLDPNTIERWLSQAAEHMETVSAYLIHDLELT